MLTVPDTALGATYLGDGKTRFRVWAPHARQVTLRVTAPEARDLALEARPGGYFEAIASGVGPGTLYQYVLDDRDPRPDPASHAQPQGVHGPSQVLDPAFAWEDDSWFGLPWSEYVLYELHVGTFTAEGTFDALVPHLDYFRHSGITALELMPVAQFPGTRNWGYDGVYPFAVQHSYGGTAGLKRLVNACHRRNLAVVLDVVYNHLGPEGNYLGEFGPYFTDRYRTPWGGAVNFDGPDSDEVRRFFRQNALRWVREFHIDGLRLDAVHAIHDESPQPFLAELAQAVRREARQPAEGRPPRRVYITAENDRNDPRLVRPRAQGGLGLDAVWDDDFHHALHTLLTGERNGYYQDFGSLAQLARAYRAGFVYAGEYSPFRRHRQGAPSDDLAGECFVAFAQNHDQVGNRPGGDRLSVTLSPEGLKLAAGAVLLSPFVPLLFMGEEYGESAPFLYFVEHGDRDLIASVREGRRREFADFFGQGEPTDPQSEEAFRRSRLDHGLRRQVPHRHIWDFYRQLLHLRRTLPLLRQADEPAPDVYADETNRVLLLGRAEATLMVVLHFGPGVAAVPLPLGAGRWTTLLDSAHADWGGPGSRLLETFESPGRVTLDLEAQSVVVFQRA